MVRRWSYLNNINNLASDKIFVNTKNNNLLLKVFQQTTFKATTYYRKPIYNPLVTKITRKNFYRRRHLNNWLVYQNILTLWSKEYLFFRKYSRTLLSLFFYKNNFLIYNALIHSNTSVDSLRGYENSHMTHVVKAVKFFCRAKTTALFPFFTTLKCFSFNWISTPRVNLFQNPKTQSGWDSLYTVTTDSLLAKPNHPVMDTILPLMFQLNHRQQLVYYTELYKLFIFLTWLSIVNC